MADDKETWDLSSILAGKTTAQLKDELTKAVDGLASVKDHIDQTTPEELGRLLDLKERISVLSSRIGAHLELRFAEDTNDQDVLSEMTAFEQWASHLDEKLLFFPLWLMKVPQDRMDDYLTHPGVAKYGYYLRKLRLHAPYTKSEEIERVLTIKDLTGGSASSSLYEVMTNAYTFDVLDRKGLTREEAVRFVHDPDPTLRQAAYEAVLGKYGKESLPLSELYKNIALDWYNESVRIRGHKDSREVRDLRNDIPKVAVDALLTVVRRNAGVFAEYFKLKHDLNIAGGKEYPFSRYHLYAPYSGRLEKDYPYQQSKELVLSTYKGFSEEFYKDALAIFDAKHVHSHPQARKRSGAFCYSVHPGDVPFILLNHTDTLRDVFTMMHEFGHGIHGMLARKQHDLQYHAPLPMAETASIFGEMLLAQRLLSDSEDDEEKKAILMQLLDSQYASIVRQSYFVIFEEEAHRRFVGGVKKDDLDALYLSLLHEQFGEMEVPEVFKHEWNYIPHIHATPFYCYAYAWGNLLVLSLYAQYLKDGERMKEKYKRLLSMGGSASPAQMLALFGADASSEEFWEEGFAIIKDEIARLKDLAARRT